MPFLPDVSTSSVLQEDADKKINSLAKQLNEWGRAISNEDRTKIIKDDSGTPRLLMGYHENGFTNGNVGVKMSQPGESVEDATDDELIFSTDFNLFKIIQTGTFNLAALDAAGGADTETLVISTGISSTAPLVYMGFVVNDSGGYNQLPLLSFNNSGLLQIWRTMAVELSGGQVQLRVFSQNYTGFATAPTTGKYFLMAESAA